MRTDLSVLSRRRLIAATAGLALAPGLAMTAEPEVWIPLTWVNGLMALKGTINGRPVDIILDSGAGSTVVDRALADALRLPMSGSVNAVGTTGETSGARVGRFTLAFSGFSVDYPEASAVALDLSGSGVVGVPLAVVLGRDIFEAAVVDLDLPGERIAFTRPEHFRPPSGVVNLPLRRDNKRLRWLEVSIAGQGTVPATFDLGSGLGLEISGEFARRRRLLDGRRTSTWMAFGVEGLAPYTVATLPSLRIGNATLTDIPAAVTSPWQDPHTPAVIGMPVWRRFRVITDYAHNRLWLAPSRTALTKPFAKERSGVGATVSSGGMDVIHIAPGSPAEAAGWRVGERITAVDGRPATREMAGWGWGEAGVTVELTLAGGETRRLVLTDYY
ncbi:MAG: aspartyl protease family protein [Pseudomonadota bacterium]